MRKMQQVHATSICVLVLLVLVVAAPGSVFARGDSVELPGNASENKFGNGWECDHGYRMVDETCVAIKVPANGYLTDSTHGSGWACDHGYRAVKEACVAVKVAENAHLNFSGSDWECNRPYRKKLNKCSLH
jgi:hypothetical protein